MKEGEAVRFTTNELYRISCILATAEYCVETTQQLEEKLNEKLGAHASKLSMEHECSMFVEVIETSISLLVQDLDAACEPLFTAITKTAWQSIDKVGDQSAYVSGMISQWKSTVPTLRDYLATTRKYFVIFCQQFAKLFMEKYISALQKCKGINKLGARQLLLNTQRLKTALLDLPSIGLTVKRKPPNKYSKLIVREMGRTEMVLKVVMAPVEQLATFIEPATKLIPDCGSNEFSKILDMKGFKKTEQGPFIETFKTKTSGISHSHYSQLQELDSPESNESWWHWILDALLCNGGGILIGMLTLKYFRVRTYEGRGLWNIPDYTLKIKCILAQFGPHSWIEFHWIPTSSFGRWMAVLGITFVFLVAELNTFYLKFVLWVPPGHYMNLVRLFALLFWGAVGLRETFQYLDDSGCKTFGRQSWIIIAIVATEFLIVAKCDPVTITKPLPNHIAMFWVAGLACLTLWTIWNFGIHRLLYQDDTDEKEKEE